MTTCYAGSRLKSAVSNEIALDHCPGRGLRVNLLAHPLSLAAVWSRAIGVSGRYYTPASMPVCGIVATPISRDQREALPGGGQRQGRLPQLHRARLRLRKVGGRLVLFSS